MKPKSFLRWVGGKQKLLPELLKRAPEDFDNYVEPFLGGGSLFFALSAEGKISDAYLSDNNSRLVRAYRGLRTHLDEALEELDTMRAYVGKEDYYAVRRGFNLGRLTEPEFTARFIYLNRTCFNGLYRENSKGEFNVPYGHLKNPVICDEENLRACSKALQKANLLVGDFFLDVSYSGNAFVYFDPPYLGTYAYGQEVDLEFYRKLRDVCSLIRSDSKFMITHYDHPDIRELFKDFHIEGVPGSTCVSGKTKGRGKRTELIIRNYK